MRAQDQMMEKLRLRQMLEELLDSELVQLDLQVETESQADPQKHKVKRISLVARYIPT